MTPQLAIASDITSRRIAGSPLEQGEFSLLREPSGIIRLDQDTLMVIEDESDRALRRLHFSEQQDSSDEPGLTFSEYLQPAGTTVTQRLLLSPLDDLEGIAKVDNQRFFVIGSHESAGKRSGSTRNKLVLFTREGNELVGASMTRDLQQQLATAYPALDELWAENKNSQRNALSIEGLAYDRKRAHLLIGLRTPTIDDDAVVVTLRNAQQYLEGEAPQFKPQLQVLDLDKNGIRALAYDDASDKLLIISKRERGGSNRFTLWSLAMADHHSLVRYESEKKRLFNDVEGLVPIDTGVLFVRDSGGKKSDSDNAWFLLGRSQLALDN